MSHANAEKGQPPDDKFVDVRVITTASVYPVDGTYDRTPDKQKLQAILQHAASKLGITDTSNFVVKINGSPVDATRTYEDLGLHGQVDIHWGPDAGGGGGE